MDTIPDTDTSTRSTASETLIAAGAQTATPMEDDVTSVNIKTALAEIDNEFAKGLVADPVKEGTAILLSENLFSSDDGGLELLQIRQALAPLIACGVIDILPPEKLLQNATNRSGKWSKKNLSVVFAEGDIKEEKLLQKQHEINANILMLGSKLSGKNYLYLKGVIGLARAMMAGDKGSVANYYKTLSGEAIDKEILDLFKDGDNVQNNISFAVKAILRFVPITQIGDTDFLRRRLEMESFLIAA